MRAALSSWDRLHSAYAMCLSIKLLPLHYGSLFTSFLCEAKNPYLAAPSQELTQELGHDHPLLQHLYKWRRRWSSPPSPGYELTWTLLPADSISENSWGLYCQWRSKQLHLFETGYTSNDVLLIVYKIQI